MHSLIISPVKLEDSGVYEIVAGSRAGEAACSMQLTVFGTLLYQCLKFFFWLLTCA